MKFLDIQDPTYQQQKKPFNVGGQDTRALDPFAPQNLRAVYTQSPRSRSCSDGMSAGRGTEYLAPHALQKNFCVFVFLLASQACKTLVACIKIITCFRVRSTCDRVIQPMHSACSSSRQFNMGPLEVDPIHFCHTQAPAILNRRHETMLQQTGTTWNSGIASGQWSSESPLARS